MDIFNRLGDDIQRCWAATGSDLTRFPAIAGHALRDYALHRSATYDDVAAWALTTQCLPPQTPDQVGQPPINVYAGHGFGIVVLTWLDATTDIHQHSFSGAFQVFAGSSLHTQYSFDLKQRIDPHLLAGDVRCQFSELLKTGDVREIGSGTALIHSLFHLDHPSVSIVVQTSDEAGDAQYSYRKPFLAVDAFHEPPSESTQIRLLQTLAAIKHPKLMQYFELALSGSNGWMAYKCLEVASQRLNDASVEHLVAVARRRHGDWIDKVLPCLEEKRRMENITLRRASTTDPHERFLLALLLNLPDRESILDMVGRRYASENPVAHIVRVLARMAEAKRISMDLNDVSIIVLERLLNGDDEEAVLEALSQRYGTGAVVDQKDAISLLIGEMQQSTLLAPLFVTKGSL